MLANSDTLRENSVEFHSVVVSDKEKVLYNYGLKENIKVLDIEVHSMIMTPDQAEYHLKYDMFPGQRKVKQKQVDFLASEMTKGNFSPGSEVTFVKFEDKLFLENGQHRLNAIVQSQTPQRIVKKVLTVEAYTDICSLYGNEDFHDIRPPSVMLQAFQTDRQSDLSVQQEKQLVAAFNLIANKFSPYNATKHSRIDTMHGVNYWSPYAKQYYSILTGQARLIGNRLRTRCPMALAIIMLKYANKEAQEFWYQVATGQITGITDVSKVNRKPTNHLRNFFLMYQQKAANIKIQGNNAGTKYTVNFIVSCWNAFIDQRDISHVTTEHLEKSFKIARIPDLEDLYNIDYSKK